MLQTGAPVTPATAEHSGEIRFLHTADWHLDRYFPGLGENAPLRRRETYQAVARIVDLAIERKVNALLVSGDVFDQPDAASLRWVQAQLSRLADAGIRALILPGNHDPLPDCRAWTQAVSWPANVTVFRNESPVQFPDIPGITFYPLPFQRPDAAKRPFRASGTARARARNTDGVAMRDGGFHVALVHGQYRLAESFGENYGPIDPDEIEQSGFHYIALGHYHSFLDCSRGGTKAFYPGSPVRLDFSDQTERRVLLVTLSWGTNGDAAKVGVESIPFPDRRFLLINQATATLAMEAEALYRELDKLAAASPDAVVRLRLSGITDGEAPALARDLEERYGGAFFGFSVDDQSQLRPALNPGDQTVLGAFARRMEQHLQQVSAPANPQAEHADGLGPMAPAGPELIKLAYTLGVTALRGGKLG